MSVGTLIRGQAASADAEQRGVLSTPHAAALFALTALGAVLRFTRIGHQGFWFDEGNTALLVHFSPGKMIGLIPKSESTPPFYYLVAWVWARIFGHGEVGLRSLSALAGVATVPVAYGAARKLISVRAGLIAAALTACNPLLIWYSQEARSYALLVLLTAVALLAFAYARADPTPRALLWWAIASGLALATHYFAVLAIVPQAIWLLASHRRNRGVLVAVGAVAACGLALIPLAISQNGTGNSAWIAPIPLDLRLEQVVPQFLVGFQLPAQGVLYPVAFVCVLIGLALLATRASAHERRGALVAGGLALAGLVMMLVLVAGGVDDLITRNVIALWLPASVLVAGGLGARRAGVVGVGAAGVLCAIGIVGGVGVATDRTFQRPDWRVVARALGPAPTGGAERAILVQHYQDLLPLSLYEPGLRFLRHGTATVRELDVVSISAPRVRLCWWGAACNLSGSPMQTSYAIPGFHVLWRRTANQFTVMRLVAERPVTLTRLDVARALTATTLRHDELLAQR